MLSTTIVDTGGSNGGPPGLVAVQSIVDTLAFLASDAAQDIYGATLPVFGSQTPPPGGPPGPGPPGFAGRPEAQVAGTNGRAPQPSGAPLQQPA